MESGVLLNLSGPLHSDSFDVTVVNCMSAYESIVYTFDKFHYGRPWEGMVQDYSPLLPGQERHHSYQLQLRTLSDHARLLQRSRTLHFQFGVSYCVLDPMHDDRDTPVDVHMHPDETVLFLGRIFVPRHISCDYILRHTID
jgi:hypothetical protein